MCVCVCIYEAQAVATSLNQAVLVHHLYNCLNRLCVQGVYMGIMYIAGSY